MSEQGAESLIIEDEDLGGSTRVFFNQDGANDNDLEVFFFFFFVVDLFLSSSQWHWACFPSSG